MLFIYIYILYPYALKLCNNKITDVALTLKIAGNVNSILISINNFVVFSMSLLLKALKVLSVNFLMFLKEVLPRLYLFARNRVKTVIL